MTHTTIARRMAFWAALATLAGCMNLTVSNDNNPDRVRATSTPGDVEGLIAGTYQRFWPNVYGSTPTIMLSEMAYEFSTPFLCFGGPPTGQAPRPAWNNNSPSPDARL